MEIFASVLDALLRASLHGAVAIAAVWLVCRLFPSLPAALRCGLWWLACLKLLVALVWVEPIPLAVLPAAQPSPRVETRGYEWLSRGDRGEISTTDGTLRPIRTAISSPGLQPGDAAAPSAPLWPLAFVNLWALGVLVLLGVTLHQLAAARRLLREAEPVREPWLRALFAELRERLGVGRAELLASAEVETPQVSGAWRPRVVLPRREIDRLSAQELSLTLGHELLHVRRGDLWLGWIPALAQRLFFFHPLAWLAAREYAVAREAACDAAVLRALDPAPEMYGRLLLRLGVRPRVRMAAAGAAPTFQTLKRRLEMLQQSADKKRVHPGWWALLALVALVALVPIQIVSAHAPAPPEPPGAPAEPAEPAEPGTPAEPAAPGEPVAPVEPGMPTERVVPGKPVPVALPVPPVPPVARLAQVGAPPPPPPAAPAAPPAPPPPPAPPEGGRSWRWHGDNGESYVLLFDEDSAIMSGSTSDVREARKHRGNSGAPLLWFERNGKSYVIRDAAVVAQARGLFKEQMELGAKQGALGGEQGKLGGEQGRIGAEMGTHGARIGELAARQASRALAGEEGDDESLEAEMEEISEKMEALGREMEKLGEKQAVLGEQQAELGRLQEKIARDSEPKLRALLDKAVASGMAQEVDR